MQAGRELIDKQIHRLMRNTNTVEKENQITIGMKIRKARHGNVENKEESDWEKNINGVRSSLLSLQLPFECVFFYTSEDEMQVPSIQRVHENAKDLWFISSIYIKKKKNL